MLFTSDLICLIFHDLKRPKNNPKRLVSIFNTSRATYNLLSVGTISQGMASPEIPV